MGRDIMLYILCPEKSWIRSPRYRHKPQQAHNRYQEGYLHYKISVKLGTIFPTICNKVNTQNMWRHHVFWEFQMVQGNNSSLCNTRVWLILVNPELQETLRSSCRDVLFGSRPENVIWLEGIKEFLGTFFPPQLCIRAGKNRGGGRHSEEEHVLRWQLFFSSHTFPVLEKSTCP